MGFWYNVCSGQQSRIVINFDNHYQNKPLANHCSNSRPRDIIDKQLREIQNNGR